MQKQLFASFSAALLSFAAGATSLDVDCGTQSLQAAINSLDAAGPHFVSVTGTCVGSVAIARRNNITLAGADGAPATIQGTNGNAALAVQRSRGINLFNLRFTGNGAGLRIVRASEAYVSGCVAENNAAQGVVVNDDSEGTIDTSTIQNNGGAGIAVNNSVLNINGLVDVEHNRIGVNSGGSRVNIFADDQDVNTFSNNTGGGLAFADGSRAQMFGPNAISNNGGGGVFVFHASTINLFDAVIENNGDVGVSVQETSHGETGNLTIRNNGLKNASAAGFNIQDKGEVYFDGNSVISGNAGPGVAISTGGLLSEGGGNTITNNGGDAFRVTWTGLLHFFDPASFGNAADTVTGNKGYSLYCDSISHAVGPIPKLPKVRCAHNEDETDSGDHGARHAAGERP